MYQYNTISSYHYMCIYTYIYIYIYIIYTHSIAQVFLFVKTIVCQILVYPTPNLGQHSTISVYLTPCLFVCLFKLFFTELLFIPPPNPAPTYRHSSGSSKQMK